MRGQIAIELLYGLVGMHLLRRDPTLKHSLLGLGDAVEDRGRAQCRLEPISTQRPLRATDPPRRARLRCKYPPLNLNQVLLHVDILEPLLVKLEPNRMSDL